MIKKLDWSHDNILAYEASGKMTRSDHEKTFTEMENSIGAFGKIRLFILLTKMAYPELKALGLRFNFAKKHLKDIERYAVVSDLKLINTLGKIGGVFPGKFRNFRLCEEKLARQWLQSDQVTVRKSKVVVTIAVLVLVLGVSALMIKAIRSHLQRSNGCTSSNQDTNKS